MLMRDYQPNTYLGPSRPVRVSGRSLGIPVGQNREIKL